MTDQRLRGGTDLMISLQRPQDAPISNHRTTLPGHDEPDSGTYCGGRPISVKPANSRHRAAALHSREGPNAEPQTDGHTLSASTDTSSYVVNWLDRSQ